MPSKSAMLENLPALLKVARKNTGEVNHPKAAEQLRWQQGSKASETGTSTQEVDHIAYLSDLAGFGHAESLHDRFEDALGAEDKNLERFLKELAKDQKNARKAEDDMRRFFRSEALRRFPSWKPVKPISLAKQLDNMYDFNLCPLTGVEMTINDKKCDVAYHIGADHKLANDELFAERAAWLAHSILTSSGAKKITRYGSACGYVIGGASTICKDIYSNSQHPDHIKAVMLRETLRWAVKATLLESALEREQKK